MNGRAVWALAVLGVVVVGLIGFGIIGAASNLWAAAGVALIAFGGVSLILPRRNPMVALIVVSVGLLLMLVSPALPTLSVADALSFGGAFS